MDADDYVDRAGKIAITRLQIAGLSDSLPIWLS